MKSSVVRILLVGEPGVGKTSLILSLVSEEFPHHVPARAEEITIPPDVTPERVPTHIVDFSAVEQTEAQLRDEISKASVVIIVYDLSNSSTRDRIREYWLPLIRSITSANDPKFRKPVIIAGNKEDMKNDSDKKDVISIMREFSEVETCIECSAKNLKNISEMFYYAQKAVIHPTPPIYNVEDKELTPRCKKALVRVFKICDIDGDDLLNDRELNTFQRRCFNTPLHPDALKDMKNMIIKQTSDGIRQDSLTLKGFIFLQTLFLQKARHETTWTVLRKFGHDDELGFADEYLHPHLCVRHGSSTELTHDGYKFLTYLFNKHDIDRDLHLNPSELASLFSLCPVNPWGLEVPNTVTASSHGWIDLSGFLSMWTLMATQSIGQVMEQLAYLGYNYEHESQMSAIQLTRPRDVDLSRGGRLSSVNPHAPARNVFVCQVIGARGVGKTCFLQGLLGRTLKATQALNEKHLPHQTIAPVDVLGQNKHLILHEIDVGITDLLTEAETRCDVVVLMYCVTDPSSFDYVARIYLRHFSDNRIPVLLVAGKSELYSSNSPIQDYPVQPAEFARQHKLRPPQNFLCVDNVSMDLYAQIATMATYPNMDMISSYGVPQWAKYAGGVGISALALYGIYKWWQTWREPDISYRPSLRK